MATQNPITLKRQDSKGDTAEPLQGWVSGRGEGGEGMSWI